MFATLSPLFLPIGRWQTANDKLLKIDLFFIFGILDVNVFYNSFKNHKLNKKLEKIFAINKRLSIY